MRVWRGVSGFHVETLIIHKLGFNQNYYTFALTLLIKIVLCQNKTFLPPVAGLAGGGLNMLLMPASGFRVDGFGG